MSTKQGGSVSQLVDLIRSGRLSAEELTAAYLERIAESEPNIGAWAHLDADYALEQARAMDDARRAGEPVGPLHGIPVGIKDIIDTADMPTENGTPLHAGRQPREDATVVARLRAAGAVILGKTVTTELATYAPGKTRNPHNPAHTPGGSSSGSAAAVAAGMVPLALGTQTNGSVIRPAAFCGVHAYKPSFGLISRAGILRQSPPLDQVGLFAGCLEDAALCAETLIGFDAADPATRPRAVPALAAACREAPPHTPRLAFIKTPVWSQADAETHEAFVELTAALEGLVEEIALPESFGDAWAWQQAIMEADLARSFAREYEFGRERLSASLIGQIERGREVRAVYYNDALEGITLLQRGLGDLYQQFDAIITPAAPGTAPHGLDATGSPLFCTLWTLCGMPALNLPMMNGENGLPLGLQMVGFRGDDARLLRTAAWLERTLSEE